MTGTCPSVSPFFSSVCHSQKVQDVGTRRMAKTVLIPPFFKKIHSSHRVEPGASLVAPATISDEHIYQSVSSVSTTTAPYFHFSAHLGSWILFRRVLSIRLFLSSSAVTFHHLGVVWGLSMWQFLSRYFSPSRCFRLLGD